MRVCVIFNPAAGGEKAGRAATQLRALGPEAILRPTAAAGMARQLAAEAVRDGFTTIAAVGGDGTINEVLNGMADEPEGWARARLAVLPQGTANVLARELGLPRHLEKAWQVVQQGRERVMDVIETTFQREGETQRRAFIQLAGAGFDARATELVDWKLKKRAGYFAYVVACLKVLREQRPIIEASSLEKSARGELILIGNGRFYGGSFRVFPGAEMSDGLMDVCVFPKVSYGVTLQCCWAAATDGWRRLRPVQRFRVSSLNLKAQARVPLELDGEPVGILPASCRVLPSAVRVVVP